MALSNDLISQFVKITNDKAEKKKESTVYGTTVIQDDTIYVRLDGSELLTPVTTASNTKNGERVIVMIKDHTAVITGNVSSPSARIEDIEDQSNAITEIEILVADKVDTSELNAVNARIDTLVSEDVLIKGQLTAAEADIDNLQVNTLNINDKLTATEATIKELETDKLDASIAEITYATITDLDATNTTVHNLEATYGNFASLTTERFNALDATIDDLDATYATITDLNAERARIDILEAGTLSADSAIITELQADVANIDTLIFGTASGNVIQTSFANAVIAQLGNAQIKSAMIESISADKITTGDIITNNVRVRSEDGKLLISDETIQISDTARVRVQIGKDAAGDYSINIWDTDGNLMFSEGGITDNAIKEAIIRDDMVSDTANIAAHKLNIESLFEEINGSEHTIQSSKIYLDAEGQTLDFVFTDLSSQIDDLEGKVTSQGTQLSVVQGQISSKVWQQDINTATDEMSTKYTTLEQTVDNIDLIVASHTANLTNVNDRVSGIEIDLTGVKSTVSNTTNIATQAYNNTLSQADVTNYAQLNDDTASKWGFTADETADGHWYTMDVLSRDKFISGWHDCVGGERFRVSYEISTSFMGNSTNGGTDSVYRGTAIGLYCYDAEGGRVGINYAARITGSAEAPITSISNIVSLTDSARQFRVSVQTESYGNFSGTIKIRNVRVEKIDKELESQVEINEAAIIQNAENITAAVSRISNNETAIASLELTADGLTTRVSNVETDAETALVNAANAQADIDELEIGGRNLFEKSDDLSSGAIGQYFAPEAPQYTITRELDSATPSGSCVVCAISEITTAITNGGFYLSGPYGKYVPKMIVGEMYTVSVWTKGSRAISYGAMTAEFLKDIEVINRPNLSTEWQRYIIRGIYNGNTTASNAITFYYNTLIQSNDVFYFSSPKVEKGNRATDWTLAPEDLAKNDDVELAQTTADGAQETATNAETLVRQLSDSISMLVTDGNGTSLMTQTETGWTFSTAKIQATIASAAESLNALNSELGDTNNTVNVLQQAVDDLGEIAEYVKISTYEDEPCIELGESDSEFKLRITNTRILFLEGSSIIAHISNQSLHIKKAVIEEELQQGGFVWKVRSNGNMGLVWKGVTN